MKTSELKKIAKANNVVILSIRKDRKYYGFNVRYFERYENAVSETFEAYFSSRNEIEYWITSLSKYNCN